VFIVSPYQFVGVEVSSLVHNALPSAEMKSNEQGVPYNRYQPLYRRSLCVASWLYLRFIAGSRW